MTDLLKAIYAALPADLAAELIRDLDLNSIQGSTIIIDFSMIAFQYGAAIQGTLADMNCGCITGFLSLIYSLRRLHMKVLVVFDQSIEGANAYSEGIAYLAALAEKGVPEAKGVEFASVLQAKTETRQQRIDARGEREEATKKEQFHVTRSLVDIIEMLCRKLNIPSFRPLVEADWLLASLAKTESELNPTYIITEDTDLLVYDIGKAKVLRRFSLTGMPKHHGLTYQAVDQGRIWNEVGLTSNAHRAYLAAILGCDYYDGVSKLGPKSVMHVLQIEPRYGCSARLAHGYRGTLLPMLVIREDQPISFAAVDAAKQAKLATEFAKKMLSPTCFDGMDPKMAKEAPSPLTVGILSINHFLTRCYSGRLSDPAFEVFIRAVKTLQIGPLIEMHKLQSGKYGYMTGGGGGGEAASPTSSSAATPSAATSKRDEVAMTGGGSSPDSEKMKEMLKKEVGASHVDEVVRKMQLLGIGIVSDAQIGASRELLSLLGMAAPSASKNVEETVKKMPAVEEKEEAAASKKEEAAASKKEEAASKKTPTAS